MFHVEHLDIFYKVCLSFSLCVLLMNFGICPCGLKDALNQCAHDCVRESWIFGRIVWLNFVFWVVLFSGVFCLKMGFIMWRFFEVLVYLCGVKMLEFWDFVDGYLLGV